MRNVSDQQTEDANRSASDAHRSTSSATSYNNSSTQQTSSNQQPVRVNRVAFDLPVAQESNLVFDVTNFDDFTNLRVAMVSEDVQLMSFADASNNVEQVTESLFLSETGSVVSAFTGVAGADISCNASSFHCQCQDVCIQDSWIVSDFQVPIREFSHADGFNRDCKSFELCSLFQLDDRDHSLEVSKRLHGLELYETVEFSWKSGALKRFDDSSYFQLVHETKQTIIYGEIGQ